MSIVVQYDPRAHVTYAYHNESTWDKELKKAGSSRTLIGRINQETGEIERTSGTRRKKPVNEEIVAAEVEAYNSKVREKRKLEAAVLGDTGTELQKIKQQYADIQNKYDEVMMILKTFADSIRQVL